MASCSSSESIITTELAWEDAACSGLVALSVRPVRYQLPPVRSNR